MKVKDTGHHLRSLISSDLIAIRSVCLIIYIRIPIRDEVIVTNQTAFFQHRVSQANQTKALLSVLTTANNVCCIRRYCVCTTLLR